MKDFLKVEAEERAKQQSELVRQVEREVLAALKGQVRFFFFYKTRASRKNKEEEEKKKKKRN